MTTTHSSAATNAVNAQRNAPEWFDTLRQRFARGEAHMFLLHGNIHDFQYPGWPVTSWLQRQFMRQGDRPGRDVVMSIGVDRIEFPNAQMRRLFETTMGFELPSDPDERAAVVDPQHPDDVPLPTEPSAMLRLALDFLKLARFADPDRPDSGPKIPGGAKSAALIVTRLDLIIPNGEKHMLSPERLKLLELIENGSTDRDLEYAQNPVVLMTPSVQDVHNDVRQASGLRMIKVPLPDTVERLQFIRDLIQLKPWMKLSLEPEDLANITAGQNRRDIEDITLRAGDQPLTRQMALDRGAELMDARYGSVLRRLEPTFGFDGIGGNEHLKQFITRKVIGRMRRGMTKGVPMGMALCGPPGTGKTALAMAAAYEAKINAIEIMNLKDKWVGNSEKNLELLIEGAEMFAPTIMVIDEFDKAFGSSEGGGDHPVDAAMRKRMQEWLALESHRGRIFLIAGTNYPDRVDPALMRTGRIDVKAPMLAPETVEERVDILARLLVRYGQEGVNAVQLLEFGEFTRGWVGSDLEFAVSQAIGDVQDDPSLDIIDVLREAIESMVPADNAAIRAQTEAALKACNVLSLLPARERERRHGNPRAETPDHLGTPRQARREEDGPVI